MNWFAEACKNDVLLDPFCGSGAIPLQRALHFPTKQIYAFDIESAMIGIVKRKIAQRRSLAGMTNIILKRLDIKNLDLELPAESIDKIVTDPPWGLYENIKMDIVDFYKLAFSKMEKVLKTGGIIVMLVGRQINIEPVLKEFPMLSLVQNFSVLISGKKANIIKLKRQ